MAAKTQAQRRLAHLEERAEALARKGKTMPDNEVEELQTLRGQVGGRPFVAVQQRVGLGRRDVRSMPIVTIERAGGR